MFYCLSVHFLFIENFASIFVYCCPVLQTKSYYAVKYRILYVNELITKLLLFLYLNFKTPNLSGKHTQITICTMKNYIITIQHLPTDVGDLASPHLTIYNRMYQFACWHFSISWQAVKHHLSLSSSFSFPINLFQLLQYDQVLLIWKGDQTHWLSISH